MRRGGDTKLNNKIFMNYNNILWLLPDGLQFSDSEGYRKERREV